MADAPFLRLARKTFENFLWKEERAFSRFEAWLDLVQSSAYEPQKRLIAGELIDVPRGGIVASERFLSNRWKWSRTKVRAFLDLLLKEGMIKPDKNHRQSVFLLCNFDKYNPQKNHQTDQRGTSEEPPGNQIEEGKEGGEVNHPPPARARGVDDPPDELLTEDQAVEQARNAGVPEDFARWVHPDWHLRGGKDAAQNKVPWAGYVKKRWNRERLEWEAGTHKGKQKAHDNNNGKRGSGRIGATHDPTGKAASKYTGV